MPLAAGRGVAIDTPPHSHRMSEPEDFISEELCKAGLAPGRRRALVVRPVPGPPAGYTADCWLLGLAVGEEVEIAYRGSQATGDAGYLWDLI